MKNVHMLGSSVSAKSRQMWARGGEGGWLPRSGRSLEKQITLYF